MIPIITLTPQEIISLATMLRGDFEQQMWRTGATATANISAATTEVFLSAYYDGSEVWVGEVRCLDENSRDLGIVEADLIAIEKTVKLS